MAPQSKDPGDRHISLQEAAERLGVHYMTAYRYVRTGRLPGTKAGAEWQIDSADVERLRTESTTRAPRGTQRANYPNRLEDRLIHGDEAGAWAIIEGAMAAGMEPAEIYRDLISPVMLSIGDRWARNELTVDQEHLASNIVLRCIGRLGPRFARRGRRRGGVLLAAPAGDAHGIPLHLSADLLRGRGFDVIDLGANVPAPSIGHALRRVDRLLCVGICATLPDNDDAISDALTAIRAVSDVPVLLGGFGVTSEERALELGASVYSTSSDDLVNIVEDLASATTTAG
ncbi:MAG: B12-binding domain-containing protein [Acidimicrobiia bacterium]|nr:B12-binding domain-containing protein [Acidimicrobiia bacterium]